MRLDVEDNRKMVNIIKINIVVILDDREAAEVEERVIKKKKVLHLLNLMDQTNELYQLNLVSIDYQSNKIIKVIVSKKILFFFL
jgi:hypothetical protein